MRFSSEDLLQAAARMEQNRCVLKSILDNFQSERDLLFSGFGLSEQDCFCDAKLKESIMSLDQCIDIAELIGNRLYQVATTAAVPDDIAAAFK